ncbi:MAG TPA: universal stress protein [Smithellaceae bacterium]|nr:universal stress protein [Smithellaceae bacterium]
MYKKILIPLDGSEVAECALSHVKNLVKDGSGKEIIILKVFWADDPYIGGWRDPSLTDNINELKEKLILNSKKYLADVQSRLAAEGLQVKTEILNNDRTADTIAEYARKNGIDLIVIATHGYTGLKKMMLGSVALEVLHDATMPVLLIRPESCRT